MARPQQYDRDLALDKAMRLFWVQGYEATNLPQLLDKTGLSRSSFYSAFGDKRRLYAEALEQYTDTLRAKLEIVRASDDPAEAIYHYYASTIRPSKRQRTQSGCLITNTLIEFEGVDDELHAQALAYMNEIDREFEQCFIRAKASGKLKEGIEPKHATKLLGTIGCGIPVQLRAGVKPENIKISLDLFIAAICKEPVPGS